MNVFNSNFMCEQQGKLIVHEQNEYSCAQVHERSIFESRNPSTGCLTLTHTITPSTIHYPPLTSSTTLRRCVSHSSVATAPARVELIDLAKGSSEGLNPGCSVTVLGARQRPDHRLPPPRLDRSSTAVSRSPLSSATTRNQCLEVAKQGRAHVLPVPVPRLGRGCDE